MNIFGIDLVSSKGAVMYDGSELTFMNPEQLLEFVTQLYPATNPQNTLISWNAPLTGSRNPKLLHFQKGDFSKRDIEGFFTRNWRPKNEPGLSYKAPEGISVTGYANNPHWPITRRLFGLPQTGPWDTPPEALPFTLVQDPEQDLDPGRYIAEVHPPLAIWLWCGGPKRERNWNYKSNQTVRDELWEELSHTFQHCYGLNCPDFAPRSEYELEAYVSWVLGKLWADQNPSVILLGDTRSGCFLIPDVDGEVSQHFSRFIRYRNAKI